MGNARARRRSSPARTTSTPAASRCARAIDGDPRRAARAARASATRQGRCSRSSASSSARMYDLEMMEQMGFCNGHRELLAPPLRAQAGRAAADAASTTSRRTSCSSSTSRTRPCRRSAAMYRGDRSRKETLVEYGFRLPSALDNRPLKFEEFEERVQPGDLRVGDAGRVRARRRRRAWSSSRSSARPACSIPRSRCARSRQQVDDLLGEIRERVDEERARARHDADQAHGRGPDRVLPRARRAGALPALGHRHARAHRDPPRSAAAASSTCSSASTCCARGSTCPRCRWWRSSTPTRRASCAAARSLIQTIGRAARNVNGRVIMYADRITASMKNAIDETERAAHDPGGVQQGARHHAARR